MSIKYFFPIFALVFTLQAFEITVKQWQYAARNFSYCHAQSDITYWLTLI